MTINVITVILAFLYINGYYVNIEEIRNFHRSISATNLSRKKSILYFLINIKDSAYILGGSKAGTSVTSVEKYDYEAKAWSLMAISLRKARHQYRAVLVPKEWLKVMNETGSKGR